MNSNRKERILKQMQHHEIDQLILSDPDTLNYLTGIHIAPGERMMVLLLCADGEATLFLNKLFPLSSDPGFPVIGFDDTEDPVALLAGELSPIGTVGIDKNWSARFLLPLMETLPGLTYRIGSACVDACRMRKDDDEINAMMQSSQLNDKAIGQLIQELKPGMTELDACERLKKIYAELGAEGTSFDPLICFGAGGAEPHHDSDHTHLEEGMAVIIDIGCIADSYCSDMTRSFFFGTPDAEYQTVHNIVHGAWKAAFETVKPGIPLKMVDAAARSFIEKAGYGPFFTHRTGHGIGLSVHEFPDVSAVSETIAEPGMVFSIEPGIYLPGKFGVRIEDLVVVTENGCESLNHFSKNALHSEICF